MHIVFYYRIPTQPSQIVAQTKAIRQVCTLFFQRMPTQPSQITVWDQAIGKYVVYIVF